MANVEDLGAMRLLIELLADKWTLPVMNALCAQAGRGRFNALRRQIPAISQKSLVACLRRLESNGLVDRIVATEGRLAVEYRVTALGHSLEQPITAFLAWSREHGAAVHAARIAAEAREPSDP